MKNLLNHRYDTSKDYETLYHIVKATRIICIVDFDKPFDDGYQIRDICHSMACIENGSNVIDIGCRGYSYIWATNKEDFIKQCERKNLEYIIPTRLK